MRKQVNLRIVGNVHGVFYRTESEKYATKYEITGWVRNNEDDNSVEICAQGEEKNLKKFITWCWEGPPQARVDDVEEQWAKCTEQYTTFEVR